MNMNTAELIEKNLVEIIPDLEGESISYDETFVDLGANSIDRGELITLTLERLELEISRIEFIGADTINQLAELIEAKRPQS